MNDSSSDLGGGDFWTDQTSVLFTSFWNWRPETWGTVGWTGQRGETRRTNLLKHLTDPFITVCYVTGNKHSEDPDLNGMIAGFYLVSHDPGDRDKFTHPCHHQIEPEKWRHSLRAQRAFSYLPEYRIAARDFDPTLSGSGRALTVAAMFDELTDLEQIARLRNLPWEEVPIYTPEQSPGVSDRIAPNRGYVQAGPASSTPYIVSANVGELPRMLYILRLDGDTDAWLGESAESRSIYKIGLAASPERRRQSFQKSIPRGAFRWNIDRTSPSATDGVSLSFDAAVAGENEMKRWLAKTTEWLGGEFYLADQGKIDEAWRRGLEAAQSFAGKS